MLIRVQDLVKNYQTLRPLRIQSLVLERGTIVSLTGLDASASEMLVGLLTGAVLPDSGDVELLGKSTREVTDSEAWLAMLDVIGIVTDRAVLVAQFSIEQNLALPFTLQVDPVAPDISARVQALAGEVGLTGIALSTPVAEVSPAAVARVRLARALALNPQIVVAEHPSASLPREDVKRFGVDFGRVARRRQLAVLSITNDEVFAGGLGGLLLSHQPATGALVKQTLWQRILKRPL